MQSHKFVFVAALTLAGATLGTAPAVHAQPYYPAYSSNQPTRTPPSWSYDPYTSGAAPCPQRLPGDLGTCQDQMPPTYGQPSYWPRR